jgi:DNA-binding CsgD family transcriptional regulator
LRNYLKSANRTRNADVDEPIMKQIAKTIKQKIKEIDAISHLIPSVIIVHDLPDFNVLYISKTGLKLLNQKWSEIKGMSGQEYFKRYFNEEDTKDYAPKVLTMLQKNTEETASFFQQVRTSTIREWDWYMSMTKIFVRDHKNQPIACITTSMQIDPTHYFTAKAVRLLEENEFLKKHYGDFAKLTAREKDVLKLLALGKSALQIASELNISSNTAETHRKNIKQKLSVKNSYELAQYARAFDLI